MKELDLSPAYNSKGTGLFSKVPHCYDNKTDEMHRQGLYCLCGLDFHIKDSMPGSLEVLNLSLKT
jgi:hypothetical protein